MNTVWLRRLAWALGGALALLVAAWLAVPALLKWQVPPRLTALLGRTVTIGDIGFMPWALALTLDDFTIAGLAPGAEPLLKVKRVSVDVAISSVFRRAPVVEALEIDSPQIRVARTSAGHFDIDDLLAKFAPKPDASPSELARFALYNLQVRDAQLTFDDKPVARVHKVDSLQLALPFLSNLPADIDVKVEPRLAFKLNGTPFDSGAQATPFSQSGAGVLNLKMADLDLAPYLGYVPAALPVRLTRGSVSADVSVQFDRPKGATPSVAVKGSTSAKGLQLTDRAGAPLLGFERLQLGLRDVQPLVRKLAFDTLRIDKLKVHAARDASGNINLLGLAGPKGDAPAAAAMPASAASGAAAAPAAGAWQVALESLELGDAVILWNDASVKPAAALQLDGLAIAARQIQWPVSKPIPISLKGALHAQGAAGPALATLAVEGPVTDREAQLKIDLRGLSLATLDPYLAQTQVQSAEGTLAAQVRLDWAGAVDAPRLKVAIDSLTIDGYRMREGEGRNAKDVFALKQLAVGDSQVDVLKHHVDLGSLKLLQPTMTLVREADGRLNLQRRMAAGDAKVATAVASVALARTAKSAEGAWTVQIKDALIDGGQVAFTDLLMQRGADPVRVSLSELHLGVQGVAWPAQRTAAPAKVQLSTRIDRSAIERGKARARGLVEFKGGVGLEPMMASGKLRVERFPVQLFDPYVTKQLQVSLLRAEAGYKGDVFVQRRPAGLDVKLAGDVLIGDLSVVTKPEGTQVASAGNTEDLLAWQALAMKGLKFTMAPAVLPRLDIDDVAITDLDTKLIITEQGKLNLQTVAQTQAAASSASAASATGSPAVKPSVPSAAPVTGGAASASSGADVGDTLPIDVRVGAVRLINGRVDFTDHFIRPNYSAVLSDLNGQVGSFSSGSRKLAEVALRGRVAGTGLLDIAGKLNPTVKPMALDIKAAATDLELAPLSAYSGKYAGYAIERGKLSVNVAYKIDPDGKLAASNQVVLNQLTFGDKVESKDATKLPVLFAVALLKDRDGVIDVNLPISGTVNDPKFSVGGIIWQVIVNLITRAVTAPFSLLTGGAGGKEHNQVEFVPGTIVMAPSGAEAIDKVARALVDRPSLKMTVTGTADPVREREAFQAATIDAKLLAEQRRENLRAGVPADAASAAPAALTTEERTRQLTRLYKATDVPGKPRNAIGFAKDIPVAEMEALLKPQIPVTDEAMRELALQRGLAVRDGLVAKGLPSDRLFLAAPKLGAPSASAASAAPAASGASGASGVSAAPGDAGTAWVPRAELSLSAK